MINEKEIPETETLAQLLTELFDDPKEKRLLDLLSKGYSHEEILEKLLFEFGGEQ